MRSFKITGHRTLIATALLFVLAAVLSLAGPGLAKAAENEKWQFQLAPYAWLAGQKGQVATLPGLPPTDLDVDFYEDIFGNINGALMLIAEARKGRMGVVTEVVYTDIEFNNSTPGPVFSSVNSRTKSLMASAAFFYRLFDKERAFLDGLVGVRYWSVDSELSLGQGLLPAREVTNKEDWLDPFLGVKGLLPLGESKFFISGAFLIGGFKLGSDFVWDANLNLGYQWTKMFATTFGYRYLDVDYEKGDFIYDIAQSGLVMGLSWRF